MTGIYGVIVYFVLVGNELDGPDRGEAVVVCPNCSASRSESPDFCSDCGEPLETEDETRTTSIVRSGSTAHIVNCNTGVEFGANDRPRCESAF